MTRGVRRKPDVLFVAIVLFLRQLAELLACKQALPLKMARGRHMRARPYPTCFDRAIKQNNCPKEEPVSRLQICVLFVTILAEWRSHSTVNKMHDTNAEIICNQIAQQYLGRLMKRSVFMKGD